MSVQYADRPKHPAEVIRYSMTFTPGIAIDAGDSILSSAVSITTHPGGMDTSSTMIMPGSVVRSGNTVYVLVMGGQDGMDYTLSFICDTANGETVIESLIVQVRA